MPFTTGCHVWQNGAACPTLSTFVIRGALSSEALDGSIFDYTARSRDTVNRAQYATQLLLSAILSMPPVR